MDGIDIPSAADVRSRLTRLSHAQVKALAAASAVPFTTLWKVRTGETRNPGVETVRQFWPHISKAGAPSIPDGATVRKAA